MAAPERRRTAPAGRPSLQAVTSDPDTAKATARRKHAADTVKKYGARYARALAHDLLEATAELEPALHRWPTEHERHLAMRWIPEARAALSRSAEPAWTPPPARPAPPMPPRPKAVTP